MVLCLWSAAQCDPIEYDVFFGSSVATVPPELQTGEVECYTVTSNQVWQVGAIWSTVPIDLSNSFEYSYYVFLGASDSGADGMVFVLSGDPDGQSAIGQPGGFLSYGGTGAITPSVALEFDTWNNGPANGDIASDHAMLHINGVMDGSAGPALNLGNIEDNQYHLVEVIWDSVDEHLTILFDGTALIDEDMDLIDDIFGGDPEVYIGFTGSTGSEANLQQVCDIQVIYTEECNGVDDDCDGIIDEDTEESYDQAVYRCYGESYTIGSSTYTTTGQYSDVFSTVLGCDSIIVTDLTIGPDPLHQQSAEICDGESYMVGGSVYTSSGTYQEIFIDQYGCDSIIETALLVHPISETVNEVSICEGESYTEGASTYTVAGSYSDGYISAAGCDSVVVTDLVVFEVDTSGYDMVLCAGETFHTPQNGYTSSGTYEEHYISQDVCDSVVIFTLDFLPVFDQTQQRYICSGGSFSIGSSVYEEEGVYSDTLTALNGCDSVVTTSLGVIDELVVPDTTVCDDAVFSLDMNPFPYHEIIGHTDSENGFYYFQDAGEGTVTVDLDGCVLSDSFVLQYRPVYDTRSYSVQLCEGESVEVSGRSLALPFEWSSGEIGETISVIDAGVYVKEYVYPCGAFQDRVEVETRKCNCYVYLPSAFTPDNDGFNDQFKASFDCSFQFFQLSIYDRTGRVIYTTTDPESGWDGGSSGYYVSPGLYHYVLNYRSTETEELTDVVHRGVVTLVR